jgi:8-oxo-dGTP pyrophosphatase MutT (NUDIX family)
MPHIHDKIDFTSEVFIVFNNKVLLRKHDKYNIWLGVGGHIELDEDPNQAAIREVKEEVGLDVTLVGQLPHYEIADYQELIAPRFLNRHKISDSHEHIAFVYFARSSSDVVTEGNGLEQSKGLHWFDENDLEKPEYNLRPSIKHYALTAIQEVQ